MKTMEIKYNPNEHIRDVVYTAYISTRPHATWTKSKKGKQEQEGRKMKQKGYMCYD